MSTDNKPLRAFHGDPAIKEKYVNRLREHRRLISVEDAKAIRRCFPESKWVAMDENGEAYAFSEKPEADNNRTMWLGAEDSYSAIPGFDNYAPDWRESLVNLDEVLNAEASK